MLLSGCLEGRQEVKSGQGWMFDVQPGWGGLGIQAERPTAPRPHKGSRQAAGPAGRRNVGLFQNCFTRTVQVMPRSCPANAC